MIMKKRMVAFDTHVTRKYGPSAIFGHPRRLFLLGLGFSLSRDLIITSQDQPSRDFWMA
jgi:hypothetical protein